MATLHHGLVVDPTNSKQIADALINILTNAEVWDEMSHNGTPSTCTPFANCPLHRAISFWSAQRLQAVHFYSTSDVCLVMSPKTSLGCFSTCCFATLFWGE